MARANLGYLPRGNPCAQCGKPIASPDWVEQGQGRISYLWSCRACDYRFEAIAIFDDRQVDETEAVKPYEHYGHFRYLAFKFGRMARHENYINKG